MPVTTAYDAIGNRTVVEDVTGTSTFTYDALSRLETATDPAGKRITYAYDARGQRASMVDPDGGRFTYAYDALDRFEHLVNPQDDRTTFSYDADSQRTLEEHANGTLASFSYDDAGRVTLLENLTSVGTIISSFDYAYDAAGNRTSVIEASGTRVTWSYDDTYQLTREQRDETLGWNSLTLQQWNLMTLSDWETMELATARYDTTFTYDPLGNRLVKNAQGALTTSVYDLANQLDTSEDCAGVTTSTYDAAGNQQLVEAPSGSLTTSTWNDENRQVKVELPDSTVTTNTFRAGGLRYEKQDSTGTTRFVWDDQNYLMETDGSNDSQAVFTNQPQAFGNLVSQYRKTGELWLPSYYHYDALGATRELTDSSETTTDTYLYDAWGSELSHTGSTVNPFRWIAQVGYYWEEENGTYHVRERVYSPTIARWLSVDPLGFPNGLNRYRYVDNRVVIAVDPTGLYEQAVIAFPKLNGISHVAVRAEKGDKRLCLIVDGEEKWNVEAVPRAVKYYPFDYNWLKRNAHGSVILKSSITSIERAYTPRTVTWKTTRFRVSFAPVAQLGTFMVVASDTGEYIQFRSAGRRKFFWSNAAAVWKTSIRVEAEFIFHQEAGQGRGLLVLNNAPFGGSTDNAIFKKTSFPPGGRVPTDIGSNRRPPRISRREYGTHAELIYADAVDKWFVLNFRAAKKVDLEVNAMLVIRSGDNRGLGSKTMKLPLPGAPRLLR